MRTSHFVRNRHLVAISSKVACSEKSAQTLRAEQWDRQLRLEPHRLEAEGFVEFAGRLWVVRCNFGFSAMHSPLRHRRTRRFGLAQNETPLLCSGSAGVVRQGINHRAGRLMMYANSKELILHGIA